MNIVSRFHRLPEAGAAKVRLTVDGAPVTARAGDSLAAALMAHSGEATRRTARRDTPRTAYCMMSICFDCLVEVDGQANVQACMTPVRNGMAVRRQSGLPGLAGSDG